MGENTNLLTEQKHQMQNFALLIGRKTTASAEHKAYLLLASAPEGLRDRTPLQCNNILVHCRVWKQTNKQTTPNECFRLAL